MMNSMNTQFAKHLNSRLFRIKNKLLVYMLIIAQISQPDFQALAADWRIAETKLDVRLGQISGNGFRVEGYLPISEWQSQQNNQYILLGQFVIEPYTPYIGPLKYLAFDSKTVPDAKGADSPFAPNVNNFDYFYLETFENGKITVPGLEAPGVAIGRGGASDSVDEDDGKIDGRGSNHYAAFNEHKLEFLFGASNSLPQYPSHVGLVFTDGRMGNFFTFEAFDTFGQSLGTTTHLLGDTSFGGTTGEDRFIGIIHHQGISRFLVHDNGGPNGIEIDHVQFGYQGSSGAFLLDDPEMDGNLPEDLPLILPELAYESTPEGLILYYSGELQHSQHAAGPYHPVVGASSPHQVPITKGMHFYRVE